MENKDFTTAFVTEATPMEAFNAINNVRAWWRGEIEGNTEKLNDEFTYTSKPHHYSKHRLTEVVPGKKVTLLIVDSQLNFVKDKNEWNGTSITFDITAKGGETEVRFTHHGLSPEVECFGACSNAWSSYINRSLKNFIDAETKVSA